jgi:4-hydroxybenzoate polyprenyltransferase
MANPDLTVRSHTEQRVTHVNAPTELLRAVRPQQWIKNLLVFGGAVFSGKAAEWSLLTRSGLAMIAFCFIASAVYLINDLRDLRTDRLHPLKRHRPLAAGTVRPITALVLAGVLAACGLGLSWWVGRLFTAIVLFYVVNNAVYSLGAKRIVIIDAVLVSIGFVLRAVAGAVAVHVAPSSWLIVCTLELSLLIVMGKRRVDLITAERAGSRSALPAEWYTVAFLDLVMATSASASIVTYALYTLAPETIARVGNRRMVLTLPMVVYGCLRYLFLVMSERGSHDPTAMLLRDWGMRLCGLVWAVLAIVAVYS